MKLNYSSLLIDEKELQQTAQTLSSYITFLQKISQQNSYEVPESSIILPGDEIAIKQIEKVVEKMKNPSLKYILDIGIGGSNLGTKAVYDALQGSFDHLEPDRFPKIIFFDTTDPEYTARLVTFLEKDITSPDEIVINIISKSGGTTETMVNAEIVFQALSKKFENLMNRIVVTTDEESKLETLAQEKNCQILHIPKQVGGRYSVFTAVGLFPLLIANVNISALKKGAIAMRQQCLMADLSNPALLSASVLFLHSKKNIPMHDSFFFHPELESLGKWYRQLTGESLGKNGKGITPLVSIGSQDLHSMVQLYLGGPKDKVTTFIYTTQKKQHTTVPPTLIFPGLTSNIENKTITNIMDAIYQGTKIAYEKSHLPTMEILFESVDEESIGEFLQFKMMEVMYLAKLMEINAFDQPNVEEYKIETKNILKTT